MSLHKDLCTCTRDWSRQKCEKEIWKLLIASTWNEAPIYVLNFAWRPLWTAAVHNAMTRRHLAGIYHFGSVYGFGSWWRLWKSPFKTMSMTVEKRDIEKISMLSLLKNWKNSFRPRKLYRTLSENTQTMILLNFKPVIMKLRSWTALKTCRKNV